MTGYLLVVITIISIGICYYAAKKRSHLFEIHELAACPRVVRELVTGFIEATTAIFRPYSPKAPLLVNAMRSVNTQQIIDLCSGNGGPWFHLASEIEREIELPVSVVLTDKFPSSEAQQRIELMNGITYIGDSIDARHVPEALQGVRTLFNGFHHFQREDAKAVLQGAVANGHPIAVFEIAQRNILTLIQAFLLPLSVLLLTPFVRPFEWWRMVLTYVIPIASLVLLWDGVVSVLRCYRPSELEEMVEELDGMPYRWEIGSYLHLTVPVTYMIGYPSKVE
jgi:hypothetical protein